MSIIGSLPNTLTNGTTADANQVMADLNYIVTQVNTNAAPLNSPSFVGTLAGVDAAFSGTLSAGGGITGTLTGNVTGNLTGNVTGSLTGNVTGNVSGSSGSCTGNSATATTAAACSGNSATATTAAACSGNSATATTASTVSNGAITPAKLSTGGPSWDGSGNVTVNGELIVEGSQPGAPNFNLRIGLGQIILQLGATAGLSWDSATQKLFLVNGSQNVASIDASGNMRVLGTVTQNVTP